MSDDPYRHHPGLRGLIQPAEESFFRTFDPADLDAHMAAQGQPPTWRYTDEEREAFRHQTLQGRWGQDLWVFAYGSLIWDPGFRFVEVRRATLASHARHFILVDRLGGRGTAEAPGAMAALAPVQPGEAGCKGVVFRIRAADIDRETQVLWRRERMMPGYHEEFLHAETQHGPVSALAFTADTSVDHIDPGLPRDKQIEYLATGSGMLGTSFDYIQNLADQFQALKIEDRALLSLLEAVKAYRARGAGLNRGGATGASP